MVVRIPDLLVTYSEQHDKIFQAIRKGNGKMAEKYMRQHLEFVKKALLRNLPKFPIL
jgi:DNA-binding FadR family transcriptional regulator